jgi:hypothetical protein
MTRAAILSHLSLPLLVLSVPVTARARTKREIEAKVETRADWIALTRVSGNPTHSAVRVVRAVDPRTKKPFDASLKILGVDPGLLRRAFRLEKSRFLLGEPLLVRLEISLAGHGKWREPIGGNYRARGRDDNFLFLLRHEDGTWVEDPYGPVSLYMGGISSSYDVTDRNPVSYWLSVQRWAAVERPGKYDLYCFHVAHGYGIAGYRRALNAALPPALRRRYVVTRDGELVGRAGRKRSGMRMVPTINPAPGPASPILKRIPAPVAKRAGSFSLAQVADYAHLRIEITRPSAADRKAMVQRWTGLVRTSPRAPSWPSNRLAAAREAIRFARQDDFVDLIESWNVSKPTHANPDNFTGLAMRSSPRAVKILLNYRVPAAISAMAHLRGAAIARAIPVLIDRLSDGDHQVRALSEFQLTRWTGKQFLRDWNGYHWKRPSLQKGRRMQPLWRAWWKKNRGGFKPRASRRP